MNEDEDQSTSFQPKANYEMKTYSREGQPDVYVPFLDGKPQVTIPQGYTETKKQVSFGGVLREPGEVKATVTESRGIRTGLDIPDRGLTPLGPKGIFLKKDTPAVDPFAGDRYASTAPVATPEQKNIDRLKAQLSRQYTAIRNGSDYRYKNENELDYIFTKQATQLAAQGINDIRDIGLEEIEKTKTLTRNIQEIKGKYYEVIERDDGTEYKPIAAEEIKNVTRDEGRIILEVIDTPDKFLINKATGQRIQTREDTGGLTNRGWGYRWGWDNSVEGSVDFGVEFYGGNAVFTPVYKSTKTDLSPVIMMASAALMAAGVPAQIGQALAPTQTLTQAGLTAAQATATQMAVGQATFSATMAAATGQNVVKAAALGGISGYAAGTITPQFNTELGSKILQSVGAETMTGAQTLGSVVSNSVVNGVMASITGQDVSKAMLMGGVTGGVSANTQEITEALIGKNGVDEIVRTTNLNQQQVRQMLSGAIVTGARALVTKQDFFSTVTDYLVIQGLSTSTANAVTKGLSQNVSKEALNKIGNVTKLTTSIFIQAKQRGLDPVRVLQQAYPTIVLRATQ